MRKFNLILLACLVFSSAFLSTAGTETRVQPIRTHSVLTQAASGAVQKRLALPPVDPTGGEFSVINRPSDFPEVYGFYIAATEERPTRKRGITRTVAITPTGTFDAENRTYKMSSITIQGRRLGSTIKTRADGSSSRAYTLTTQLSFTTASIDGISYQFRGELTYHSIRIGRTVYPENPNKTATGRLTKIRNGKRVAESEISFIWSQYGD